MSDFLFIVSCIVIGAIFLPLVLMFVLWIVMAIFPGYFFNRERFFRK